MGWILYIGTGLHLEVLQHFPNKHFILVDSSPLNAYGFDYYSRYNYRGDFVNKLNAKFTSLGFELINATSLTNNYDEIKKRLYRINIARIH